MQFRPRRVSGSIAVDVILLLLRFLQLPFAMAFCDGPLRLHSVMAVAIAFIGHGIFIPQDSTKRI